MNLVNATIELSRKATKAENVNLGYETFKPLNQALVRICKSKVLFNDRAHDWSHVVDVAETAVVLAKRAGVSATPLLLAALCHDLYATISRENHEDLAGVWVREHLSNFGYAAYSELVARMCEQHRASYKGAYTGIFEELFASADRGLFKSSRYPELYWRSYLYNTDRNPELSIKEVCGNVAAHMIDKFGFNGYAKWPTLYSEYFGEELQQFAQFVELHPTADDVVLMLANSDYLKLSHCSTQ